MLFVMERSKESRGGVLWSSDDFILEYKEEILQ